MTEQQAPESRTHPWYSKSTALTISLSVVVCVTGLMMFLKVGEHSVRGAHEWLGLAFVAVAVAHSIHHWRSIKRYCAIMPFWAVTAPVILVTALFILPSMSSGGLDRHPMKGPNLDFLGGARIEQVAEITQTPVDALVERLKSEGITVDSQQETLSGLADRADRRLPDLLAILVPGQSGH